MHYRVYLKCASAPLEEDNIFPSHCDTKTKTVQRKNILIFQHSDWSLHNYDFPQPKVHVECRLLAGLEAEENISLLEYLRRAVVVGSVLLVCWHEGGRERERDYTLVRDY